MRWKEAITSVLHLLTILFCFTLAICSLLLFVRPDLRMVGVNWLLERPFQFIWIGMGFAGVGFFFLFSFYLLERGRLTRISMGPPKVSLDRKIIKAVINDFFATHFSELSLKAEICFLPREELEILMEFPNLAPTQREQLLESIDERLSLFLHERFGYNKKFTLALKN